VKISLSLYNLDVIISIGYRVKSFRGTQFRIWANRILAAAPTAAACLCLLLRCFWIVAIDRKNKILNRKYLEHAEP
jgi:hypothetical protein